MNYQNLEFERKLVKVKKSVFSYPEHILESTDTELSMITYCVINNNRYDIYDLLALFSDVHNNGFIIDLIFDLFEYTDDEIDIIINDLISIDVLEDEEYINVNNISKFLDALQEQKEISDNLII